MPFGLVGGEGGGLESRDKHVPLSLKWSIGLISCEQAQ